jgi:hypothetical protein
MVVMAALLVTGCLDLRTAEIDPADAQPDAPSPERAGGTGGSTTGPGGGAGGSGSGDAGGVVEVRPGDASDGDGMGGAGPVMCSGATPSSCAGTCVDLTTDPKHCGRCEVACEAFQQCGAGACSPGYDVTVATSDVPGTLWDLGETADGSLFVAGIFKGTVDFDPGMKVDNQTALGALGDIFVSKFAADGGYQWTRTLPATVSPTWVHAVAAADGSVLVSGYYRGTIDFLSSAGGQKKTAVAANADEAFVVKIKSDGSFGFVRTFPAMYSAAWQVRGMRDGSLIVVGALQGPGDFGRGPEQQGISGGYVVKLAADGSTTWSRFFPGGPVGTASEADAGTVLVAGSFIDTLDLDPGPSMKAASAGTGQALFAVKLSSDGAFLSGGAAPAHAKELAPTDVTTSYDGSLFVAGRFSEGAWPTGGETAPNPRPNAGDFDAFVGKFSAEGNFVWGRAYGGTGYDQAWSLVALPKGGVLVAGTFNSPSVDFGTAVQPDVRQVGAGNFFVTSLRADGSAGGTFTLGKGATPAFIRLTATGFNLGGFFAGTIDFNPRSDSSDAKTSGGRAAFLSRYRL